MGLDISFDRNKALAAGMQTKIIRNGDDDDLQRALEACEDEDYIQWLQESSECVIIPFTEALVTNDGVGDRIIVRANKWGKNYLPLTLWLKHHNIEWDEF